MCVNRPLAGIETSNVVMVAIIGSLLFTVAIIAAINVVCIVWLRKKRREKSKNREMQRERAIEPIYETPSFLKGPTTIAEGTNAVANPLYCHLGAGKNMPLEVTNPILLASREDLPATPPVQDAVILCEMNANFAYSIQKQQL